MYTQKIGLLAILALTSMTPALAEPGSVAEQLEKAIYTEETVGDLESAITIYNKIIANADTDRNNIGRALFRQGMCYLKLNQHEKASVALKRLIQDYPDQTALTAKAQKTLDEFRLASLKLNPAPWTDGEVTRYRIISPAGTQFAAAEYSAKLHTVDGKLVWRLENYLAVALNFMQQFSRVDVTAEELKPLNGMVNNSLLGESNASYSPQQIKFKTNSAGQKSSHTLVKGNTVYSDTQLLNLLRRLPLAEGYKAEVPGFLPAPNSGQLYTNKILVKEKKSVSVPMGVFDCFEVQVNMFSDSSPEIKRTIWISDDNSKQVVKIESNEGIMELVATTDYENSNPIAYQDSATGASIAAPRGWRVLNAGSPDPSFSMYVQVMAPETKVSGLFVSKSLGGKVMPGLNIDRIVDGDLHILKGYFKNYTLRKEKTINHEISGFSAKSFVADYLYQNVNMVECRTYILGEKGIYWFVFRLKPEDVDQHFEQMEAIVGSFTIK